MKELNINSQLQVIVIPNTILVQGKDVTVQVRKELGEAINNKVKNDDFYGIALSIKTAHLGEEISKDDFNTIGTLIKIKESTEVKGGYNLLIEVIERIETKEFIIEDGGFKVTYELLPDMEDLDERNQQDIITYIKKLSEEISKNFKGSEVYLDYINGLTNISEIIAYIFPFMNLTLKEKQEFLEIRSLKRKSLKFIDILIEQKESLKFQMELAQKLNENSNKTYRENILRQQLKAIQEELGEASGKGKKKKDYKELIENANMPEDVKEVALDELGKLERQGANSNESNIIQNYLDLLVKLPWSKNTAKDINIEDARVILNQQHYGLDKVKDRIIQHLAIMKLMKNKQGSIILLVGPPGTGKTSLGRSIAEALERKYVRISLGGIKDESEIRGHRRTYIGALPGRIIQGMKKAGEKNPVFILDEIDKMMASTNGDPASALLEVLDPEQNSTFADHYLEVPYDLSDVFFIATANSLKGIPEPLRDRMEIIDVSSYTAMEKFHIAKEHLIEDVLKAHGLEEREIQIEDDAIEAVINKYTREAGVRGLKRQLSTIARVLAEKVVLNKVETPYVIKKDMLQDILGYKTVSYDLVNKRNTPGVVTGLAWTPVGGSILFIEGVFMPGNGQLVLTGKLGEVMKESAKLAQSLIRSRFASRLEEFELSKKDLHIHVPAGATPKDGPSAGIALLTTIASLVTGKAVDSELAMTGEISLRGSVLAVGGIKEKVIGAHRSGIKTVMLPRDNEADLRDVPKEVKDEIKFILVETIEEVLREALGIEL